MTCCNCGTVDCPPCESSEFDHRISEFWRDRPNKYPTRKSAIAGYYYYLHRINRANEHLKSHLLNLKGRQLQIIHFSHENTHKKPKRS